VKESTSAYPWMSAEATGSGVVSQAGAVALVRTAQATGLVVALSAALAPWRRPLATHDPGKILCDLAISYIETSNGKRTPLMDGSYLQIGNVQLVVHAAA
jgi:Transposase DDE domain group 1